MLAQTASCPVATALSLCVPEMLKAGKAKDTTNAATTTNAGGVRTHLLYSSDKASIIDHLAGVTIESDEVTDLMGMWSRTDATTVHNDTDQGKLKQAKRKLTETLAASLAIVPEGRAEEIREQVKEEGATGAIQQAAAHTALPRAQIETCNQVVDRILRALHDYTWVDAVTFFTGPK